MRIFIDSAELAEVEYFSRVPDVSGFTTNATLVKRAGANVEKLMEAAGSKEISVEHKSAWPTENVRWKTTDPVLAMQPGCRWNLTAICSPLQVPRHLPSDAIISVFAGRIMDTGRSPGKVLTLAKRTGAQVLWASSRCVYDITLARMMGCDIITVTPDIYRKYREWDGKPLEQVAEETIAQFDRDR